MKVFDSFFSLKKSLVLAIKYSFQINNLIFVQICIVVQYLKTSYREREREFYKSIDEVLKRYEKVFNLDKLFNRAELFLYIIHKVLIYVVIVSRLS